MPEFDNREDWEIKLAKDLGKLLRRTAGDVLELLGDPPDLENIPSSFWDEIGAETSDKLKKSFRRIYLESAQEILDDQPIGVDWGLVNEAASIWSDSAAFDLISGLNNTSQRVVQKAVSKFYTDQMTIGELRSTLLDAFGPVRAEMIAATEVTNAAFEGEFGVIQELAKDGVTSVAIWETYRDEFVDDQICEPLHGRRMDGETSDGRPYWIHPDTAVQYGPPAVHVRCRCWVNWDFAEEGVTSTIPVEPIEVSQEFADSISYRRSKLSDELDHAIDQMDSVLSRGEGKFKIKISGGGTSDYSGEGRYIPTQNKIQIRPSDFGIENTTLHEIGHAVDDRLLIENLGLDGRWASSRFSQPDIELKGVKEIDDFWSAVEGSEAYKNLLEEQDRLGDKHYDYLLDTRETFARAYSQYITEKTQDEGLLWELNNMLEEQWYDEQWSHSDFQPILEAMDKLFEVAGMLR